MTHNIIYLYTLQSIHVLMDFYNLGQSVGEGHFVRLRQRGDPSDGLFSRHHALLLWLEPEDSM